MDYVLAIGALGFGLVTLVTFGAIGLCVWKPKAR